jgi:hypothetical protein
MSHELMYSTAVSPDPLDENVPHKQALLDELGIIAKPHVAYEWNGYRYSNAGDAIAAARRAKR